MKEHGICVKCKKIAGCPYADDRIEGCKEFVLDDYESYNEVLTNEQWFCKLSIEEKAKWIAYQIYYATKCDVHNEKRKDWSVTDWETWLKQPYNKE